MTLRCYSQRLLNPFRGVVNIIEYGSAEAVTTDGIHWDIYVSNDELVEDIDDAVNVQTSDIRYGSWSLQQGLKRGPIQPSDDFIYMEHQGAMVYDYLLQHFRDVPFDFLDVFELWLLDSHMQPLALLDSVTRSCEMSSDIKPEWRAGNACNRAFTSSEMNVLQDKGSRNGSAGEYLSFYINSCAGESPVAQWFCRNGDGSGSGDIGVNLPDHLLGRHLPLVQFPPYFVRECLHEHNHKQLVDDFFEWQAPWLLLLHTLDRQTRRHLEQVARKRAMTVDRQYPLYPELVDESQIQAARVEAELRRHSVYPEHETVSASCMDMHPCPSE